MRALATHDRQGRITRLTRVSADGPPAAVAVGPGEIQSEIELPEGALDSARAESEDQLLGELSGFRVNVASGGAELVRDDSAS